MNRFLKYMRQVKSLRRGRLSVPYMGRVISSICRLHFHTAACRKCGCRTFIFKLFVCTEKTDGQSIKTGTPCTYYRLPPGVADRVLLSAYKILGMSNIDWTVLILTLVAVAFYGVFIGRGLKTTNPI